ncbi:MAG: protein-ADP-ribose hydrolase [Treponema sp.]|nr:protein-ADP-ribose hydrolase [Spirochaetia bacterium]MDD7459407.1 protein-ADP-ribose hydrolase [Spirochaetales bacterium]MDY5810516.1 protein-ADP-ribose hydrolase [Treponema sp.]MEE1181959.1 protein-ADP-ribose hydrolase [Treponema sp.]
MTQNERRIFLIKYLLAENPQYKKIEMPETEDEQKHLLRALFNMRPPLFVSNDFLTVQNEYLMEETSKKGITKLSDLTPVFNDDIYLWQGDITTLECGAIVNAANSALLGCFSPNHSCIDNAIHTFAGVQLRLECDKIMKKQEHDEETGKAKITDAYNLPCKYIIHTVGPIVQDVLLPQHKELLAGCYNSCLNLAVENKIDSIAFCCISTGVFGFPQKEAAQIAFKTVQDFKQKTLSKIKVIFNVFTDRDKMIYENLFK